MQAARILYTRVQFVHILHMCTLHVCCVERNICAAHILRLSIFVRVHAFSSSSGTMQAVYRNFAKGGRIWAMEKEEGGS